MVGCDVRAGLKAEQRREHAVLPLARSECEARVRVAIPRCSPTGVQLSLVLTMISGRGHASGRTRCWSIFVDPNVLLGPSAPKARTRIVAPCCKPSGKERWTAPNANHGRGHRAGPAEYEAHVLGFWARTLQTNVSQPAADLEVIATSAG